MRPRLHPCFSFLLLVGCVSFHLPGRSFEGVPPALDDAGRAIQADLLSDVRVLADDIGVRCKQTPEAQARTVAWIEDRLREAGYTPQRQTFEADGLSFANVEVEIPGSDLGDEIVVIGAHWDTVCGTPGADDNASGVAGTLALARLLRADHPRRTLRFVAFANEEPPYYHTEAMGSLVYARRCQERGENVVAMLTLESIGVFSDQPGSQVWIPPFGLIYPKVGDFVMFVSDTRSRRLLKEVGRTFRETATLPSEGAASPESITGVGWSDHWSFWQIGAPAVMVTDTAIFRNMHYHGSADTSDRLDPDRFTRTVQGMQTVIQRLANP